MRSRTIGYRTLGLAVVLGVLFASTAFAHSEAYVLGNSNNVKVTHAWSFPGVFGCTYPGAGASTPPGASPHMKVAPCDFLFPAVGSEIHSPAIDCPPPGGGGDLFAHTIQSGGCVGGAPFANAIKAGDAYAGGIGAAAASDTFFAKDSVAVTVGRNLNTLTLGNIRGRMLAKSDGKGRLGIGTIIIVVYPDTFAANADVHRAGSGALFYGRAYFSSSGKINLAPVGAIPGFSGSDFSAPGVDVSGNSFVALTGASKPVTVPSGAANAAVVLISDPGNGSEMPGASPVGLALISILMAIAGGLVLSARIRTRPA